MDALTSGLPLLVALVLVTRAESIYAKARTLIVGLLIATLATVTVILLQATAANMKFIAIVNGSADNSSYLYHVVTGYSISQPALAVCIWIALMMLGSFKERRKKSRVIDAAGNALRHRGSRRRYKRSRANP
jgi:hypothetical protein